MMLHDNWRYLLRKSWAIRWIVLAGVLSGVEVVLPLFASTLPQGVFGILSFGATVAAVIARIMVQPKDGL